MKEFNNREIAKKHAEYITGKELRRYLAEKVKGYVGDSPTVFDGAVGSGQLEEFVNPAHVTGVEIQEGACRAFKENYPNSTVENMSFFNYKGDVNADCVIMNYPFSLKFKELSEEEQTNIQSSFPWKKSGVVDDIFILKSLEQTKGYGFYICFPGIRYRNAEKKLRELLSGCIAEHNVIRNAFEDTGIDVLFLVIDKEKDLSRTVKKEIYDCKLKKVVYEEKTSVDEEWEQIVEPLPEQEPIDPVTLEMQIQDDVIKQLKKQLEITLAVSKLEKKTDLFERLLKNISSVLNEYERYREKEERWP